MSSGLTQILIWDRSGRLLKMHSYYLSWHLKKKKNHENVVPPSWSTLTGDCIILWLGLQIWLEETAFKKYN